MADIQHAAIPDANLHECKGAATASAGQFHIAVGDGTATFQDYSQTTSQFRVLDELEFDSFIDQTVSANDEEIQITFGETAGSSDNGSMSIAADGTITFNEAGVYHISVSGNAGRATSAGFSEVAFAARVNGVQVGRSSPVSIDSASDAFAAPIDVSYITNIPAAGVQLTYHMLGLDLAGVTGLYTVPIANVNWSDAPSARINITKLGNVEV